MNYKYPPERSPLRAILARNPAASLDDIRRADPALRAMTMDHLALRIDQIHHRENNAWLK